ncbi:MAG: zinc ribbon domain-containing protein [Clostridia bacterium]|nr:zinc ribbon domain-containing protein [Clostridia bacterium]
MFCPKCGKINSDNSTECSGCGTPLCEEVVKKPSKKGKAWKIAVVLVVIVAVAAVLILSGCSAPDGDMSF